MNTGSEIRFGTDGWRAIVADTFCMGGVERVADAIARYVLSKYPPERGVVIGHDTRFLAERFAAGCARVLGARGIELYMFDRAMPTPIVAHSIMQLGAAGAIMLTASHNPPEYNGIKFIPEYAGPASVGITSVIEGYLREGGAPAEGSPAAATTPSAAAGGAAPEVTTFDPLPQYANHLKDLIDFEVIAAAGLKVVVDPMFGAGQGILARFLEDNGVVVHSIHDYRDVLFGGGMPEPTAAGLSALSAEVVDSGSDLGLALDGDGDRFGIVDAGGTALSSNQVLALIAEHLLDRGHRGAVVRTVATTHILDKIAAGHGVALVETPVGFKYIAEVMMAEPVVVGGEESGGLSVAGHIPEKDGLLADLLIAELVAVRRKPVAGILEDLYGKYGLHLTSRIDIHMDEDRKGRVLARLREEPPTSIAGRAVIETNTMDGFKFLLAGGEWVLARPSGTEPLIRVYIEADKADSFTKIEDDARRLFSH